METKKARLPAMKNFTIGCRISEELRQKVEYAKLLPRGITGVVEDALKALKINPVLEKELRKMKSGK